MQEINLQSRCADNMEPLDLKYPVNEIYQKNFLRGLHNARNLLTNLEHSIHKSHKYQDKLLRCRATHKHAHDFNDWSLMDTDFSDEKEKSSKRKLGKEVNLPQLKAPLNLTESWSTMSIVCLQYQYEELAQRYENLLKAFNDKCTEISASNSSLTELRQEARVMHAQLSAAHRALLSVGEKYLGLKRRKLVQRQQYEKKVQFLKQRVCDVMSRAEKARLHLDSTLSQSMAVERDSAYAMLLAEVRKCNWLFLENLRLKARLEEFVPNAAEWT